ncbi:MAG: SipW-dependent-type signal peptide-containing protein [Candidatus Parcubacteria bacterium]|nr:SipW-dependent-type signal peptide-containing protein [Candidatus Parcubacteria bacterium]
MNKRILISLSVIGIVAAFAIGGTVAYFSDTETSAGNILVAGSLDLKVDHTKQTYNGADCKTCDVTVVSDTSNQVTAKSDNGLDTGPFPHPAVTVTNPNPAWTASIPDAHWIWWTDPTPVDEYGIDTIYTFEKTFIWYGPITDATLQLSIGTDNSYEIYLNDVYIAGDNTEQNYNAGGQDTYSGTTISSAIHQGNNTLRFVVKNWLRPVGQTWDNPGGLIYKLVIDGNCEDDYFKKNCQLWDSKDLTNEKFFNLNDVKPGDSGTNVISLTVDNNDSWVCLSTENVVNDEMSLTEPELEMPTPDTSSTGELGQNLHIFMWRDTNGDGVYDSGEGSLGSYTLANGSMIPLYDSLTLAGAKLPGNTKVYIGLAWCAGTQTINGNTITCDGSSMDNSSQSDKVTADLLLRAEQFRNQPKFTCNPN